jgi:hypothetical protein
VARAGSGWKLCAAAVTIHRLRSEREKPRSRWRWTKGARTGLQLRPTHRAVPSKRSFLPGPPYATIRAVHGMTLTLQLRRLS